MPRASRRSVLAIAAAFALRPRAGKAATVPSALDHILLGCSDLDAGIEFVGRHLGARAAVGGVHPGRGSRNALLSLGERRYLEIIAPDPQQPRSADVRQLYKIESPRLIGWAAHVDDMDEVARRLTAAGIAFNPPTPGARQRPSGQTLRWRALATTRKGCCPSSSSGARTRSILPSMPLKEAASTASSSPVHSPTNCGRSFRIFSWTRTSGRLRSRSFTPR